MFSAFNPSKWSSGQPTLQRPGSSWGLGALLKGLTSVVDTSCQSRDSNPQPWVISGFKSNTLSIRPRLSPVYSGTKLQWKRKPTRTELYRTVPCSGKAPRDSIVKKGPAEAVLPSPAEEVQPATGAAETVTLCHY